MVECTSVIAEMEGHPSTKSRHERAEGEQGRFSRKALSDFLFFQVLGVEGWAW